MNNGKLGRSNIWIGVREATDRRRRGARRGEKKFGGSELMNQDGVRKGYDVKQLQGCPRGLQWFLLIASGGAGATGAFWKPCSKRPMCERGALAASRVPKQVIAIPDLKREVWSG